MLHASRKFWVISNSSNSHHIPYMNYVWHVQWCCKCMRWNPSVRVILANSPEVPSEYPAFRNVHKQAADTLLWVFGRNIHGWTLSWWNSASVSLSSVLCLLFSSLISQTMLTSFWSQLQVFIVSSFILGFHSIFMISVLSFPVWRLESWMKTEAK